MPAFSNSDLWILENCKYALDLANGYGLSNSVVAGLTSSGEGTVAKLVTAVNALSAWSAETDAPTKRAIADAITVAGGPLFDVATPGTITSTLEDDSAGTLPDSHTFFYKVTAVDKWGNQTAPSAEDSQATGTGGALDAHQIVLTWTEVAGATSYRVWISETTDTYTGYVAAAGPTYTHSEDTGSITGFTTATIPTSGSARQGFITDTMVETAASAGSNEFTTLRNAVSDQHPTGTAFRTVKTDIQRPT